MCCSSIRPALLCFCSLRTADFKSAARMQSWSLFAGAYLTLMLLDGMHVFVAATREIGQHNTVFRQSRCQLGRVGQRMTGLQRGNDTFDAAAGMKRRQCLVVGDAFIAGAPAVFQPRVLRTDAWIVKTRRDGMRFHDLAVFILQQIGVIAVQNTWRTQRQRGGMAAGIKTVAGG